MAGVYPVYKNVFKIGKLGLASALPADMVEIADVETFSPSIDGNVEEWTPMNTDGWVRSIMTGKKFSVSLSGKRTEGDVGNDYIAGLAWKDGADCSTKAEWAFPSGAKLVFNCVVNVTALAGGDTNNVAGLEFELIADGKPTYTPAV